jgi:hypothetical protein
MFIIEKTQDKKGFLQLKRFFFVLHLKMQMIKEQNEMHFILTPAVPVYVGGKHE